MSMAVYERINSIVHNSISGHQVSSVLILLTTSGVDLLKALNMFS